MTFNKRCLVAALLLIGCGAVPPPPTTPLAKKAAPQQPVVRKESPVKLTASDGTGLELVDLTSKASVNGPLAFTELHLTFANPQDRILEGRFEITLPEGAALSRLAMRNANGWMEGEVVETQRARVAYEDSLHARQDPALLEKAAGNHFQARIFPIPGKSNKEIILAYSQELATDQAYQLPLAGLPKIHQLAVSAQIWQGPNRPNRSQSLDLKDQAPGDDFIVQRQVPVQGLVKDDLVMFSVKPELATDPVPLDNVVVLVDTSASAGPGYAEHLAQLKQLLNRLGNAYPNARVRMAAFDQTVIPLGDAPMQQADRLVAGLETRTPLGASHWNQALHWARQQQGFNRVLIVGDGVITAGHERLSDFLPKLTQAGITRLDLLAVGGIRNQESLRPLADGLGGLVLDGDQPLDRTVEALTHKVLSGVKVQVAGASWVWPDTLNGLRPGQERLIYAEVPGPGASVGVTLSGAVQKFQDVPLTPVSWPLLERAAARARIAKLTRECYDCRDEREKHKIIHHIVEMSTRFRVVSDFTALLVLENDWDYARFGLNRGALADILVMGQEGVEVQTRVQQQANGWGGRWNRRVSDRLPTYDKFEDDSSLQTKATSGPAQQASQKNDFSGDEARKNLPQFDAVQGLLDHGEPAQADESPQPPLPERAAGALVAPMLPAEKDPMENYLSARRLPSQARSMPALSGELAHIEGRLAAHQDARQQALAWLQKDPGNVLALVGYARALEAAGQRDEAARAYGSIIDLYPGRADMRRYAGCCLEALGPAGQQLAADTFCKAMLQRPDHPSSHRLLAYAELRLDHYQTAFERLERGLRHAYPWGRFQGYQLILRSDLAILGAAWAAHEPSQRAHIQDVLRRYGLAIDDHPSTRFVLTWETDATNVDLQLSDAGGHLPVGCQLLNNVTTGYGPECFSVAGTPTTPYRMSVQYSARGPMGYGMGKVEVMEHDGHGGLRFAEKPYVVMNDRATIDLGNWQRTL